MQTHGLWQIAIGNQIYRTNTDELVRWIGEGRVEPGTQVSSDGQHWIDAGAVPELVSAFNSRMHSTGLQNNFGVPPVVQRSAPLRPPQPPPQVIHASAPLVHVNVGQPMMMPGFQCPRCRVVAPPVFGRQTSSSGWAVFVLLLIFFFPLCWIGLLIREDVRHCSHCRARV